MPWNQPSHQGLVALRSVRHTNFPDGRAVSKEGTLISAEDALRIVRVRVCQSIAEGRESKMLGRLER